MVHVQESHETPMPVHVYPSCNSDFPPWLRINVVGLEDFAPRAPRLWRVGATCVAAMERIEYRREQNGCTASVWNHHNIVEGRQIGMTKNKQQIILTHKLRNLKFNVTAWASL